jgi:hypothetical protein
MVMRGVRILPLVGIVEFILYACTNYFIKRHDATNLALLNLALVYGDIITGYMIHKITEAIKHVKSMGTINLTGETEGEEGRRRLGAISGKRRWRRGGLASRNNRVQ